MTRSTARTRLVAARVGVLGVVTAALLAGCGAGQQAQTSRMQAAVSGVSTTIAVPGGGTIALRDLTVAYPGDNGYPQGGTAPLQVRIFNSSANPVTLSGVRVAPESADNAGNDATPVDGTVVLVGSPSATPASPEPSAAPTTTGAPAGSSTIDITIPAGGYVLLAPAYGSYLAVTDLSREIGYGDQVNLEFQFGNLTTTLTVPVNTPASGAPRASLSAGAAE